MTHINNLRSDETEQYVRDDSSDSFLSLPAYAQCPVVSQYTEAELAKQPKTCYDEKGRKIRRPPNAFMVFSNRRRKILAATYPGEGNNNISTRLGREWRNMPANEKKHYFDEAKRLDAEHKQKYPYYQYCPGEARKRKLQQKIVLVTSDQEEEENTPGKTTKHRKKNMPVYTVIPPNGPNQLPTLLLVNQSGGQTVRDYVTQHLMKERGSPTEMSGCCHQSQNLHSCGPVGHGQYGHVPESYQFSPPMNPGPSQGQAQLDCPEPYRILNGAPNPGAHMYHHHHHHHLSYPSQQRPNDQCQVTPSGHDISGRGTSTSAHGQHHYCIHNMNSDQRSSAAVKTSKSQPPQIIFVPVDREYASSLGYADNGNVITEVDGAQPAIGSAFENEKNLGPGEYRVPYQGNNTDSVRYGYESEYQHAAYSPNQYYTGNQSNMVTTPTWSRQVVPAAQGRPDVHDLQVPQRYIYAGHPNYEYESNNSNDEMLGLYNTGSASISNEPIQQSLTDLSSATSHETLDSKSAISFPSKTRSCVSSSDYDIEVQSGGRRSRGAALDSSYSDREQCFQAPQMAAPVTLQPVETVLHQGGAAKNSSSDMNIYRIDAGDLVPISLSSLVGPQSVLPPVEDEGGDLSGPIQLDTSDIDFCAKEEAMDTGEVQQMTQTGSVTEHAVEIKRENVEAAAKTAEMQTPLKKRKVHRKNSDGLVN